MHLILFSCLPACPRYSDFRALWKGLSRLHPLVEAFDFPPKSSVFHARSLFSSGMPVQEKRQRKFTAMLKIMVSAEFELDIEFECKCIIWVFSFEFCPSFVEFELCG